MTNRRLTIRFGSEILLCNLLPGCRPKKENPVPEAGEPPPKVILVFTDDREYRDGTVNLSAGHRPALQGNPSET